MIQKINVRRDAWDFDELADAWRMRDERMRDLRRLIEAGSLRPFAALHRPLQQVVLNEGGSFIAVGEPVVYSGRLWIAQEHALQTANLEYVYPVLRDSPTHEGGASYWASPQLPTGTLCTTDVLASFAVSDADRLNVERAEAVEPCKATLDEREERSRDALLVTLYRELYGWDPEKDEEVTGVTKLAQAAKVYGFTLSVPTIRKHILAALKRAESQEVEPA